MRDDRLCACGSVDEGHLLVRQTPLQIPHHLPPVWQGLLPLAEEDVLLVRVPRRQDASMCVLFGLPLPREGSWLKNLTCCSRVADNWSVKAKRRRTDGTGRMRTLKLLPRRFKNGFREGTQAAPKAGASSA